MSGQPAFPIVTQFPGHGCMDDLTNESSFDSRGTWVIDVLGLFFSDLLSIGVSKPGTGRRTVDWFRN